jgi:hypothetical protein
MSHALHCLAPSVIDIRDRKSKKKRTKEKNTRSSISRKARKKKKERKIQSGFKKKFAVHRGAPDQNLRKRSAAAAAKTSISRTSDIPSSTPWPPRRCFASRRAPHVWGEAEDDARAAVNDNLVPSLIATPLLMQQKEEREEERKSNRKQTKRTSPRRARGWQCGFETATLKSSSLTSKSV